MRPLRITAELGSPPIPGGPLMLDGILYGGLGYRTGARAGGWVDEVPCELPLARIEAGEHWWYAASQCTPWGPERVTHTHRRMEESAMSRWTSAARMTQVIGPDKSLRIPRQYRPRMVTLEWTCIGDRAEVADLLSWVRGVGRLVGHGWGFVRRWRVEDVDDAPNYTSPAVRPVALSWVTDWPEGIDCEMWTMPLRPPYWSQDGMVDVLRVPEVWDA